jgi:hypothetical protein
MICGPCGLERHSECNGLLRASLGFCGCADRDHVVPPTTPAKFCPLCFDGQKAFVIEQEPDGTAIWSCSQGHLTLTYPVAVRVR